MILTVKPVKSLAGAIQLPSSKSYSIRAVMIASCGGYSRILNLSDCDDVQAAVAVIGQLGCRVGCLVRNVFTITVRKFPNRLKSVNVKESGTVLRFLLPLLGARGIKAKVVGEGTLRTRPNSFLTQALRRMGLDIKGRGVLESVPIFVKGGNLKTGRISVDGTLSSQFVSALLIASPLLKN